ncbi:hypothetical protein PTSG_08634 [Salpingoeca rosetta]|uniref:Peptidase S53 domain-containing protein n=1 Tax=Salpingoeca rosetta (strain ATCC 50818 / BSB-021) TaxID=946362 RepID=F2UK87_SALR5|nr:uncharacterized protein PTSG_08634 [Salpingoeca rosetta]EGD77536.1 hypothetical protein PTSG_08634 [Salpingoeca rosetta]|eukprot:XP_004990424.1 hypothetical protein PTSG_08634 [Salpingoeca rosetta]
MLCRVALLIAALAVASATAGRTEWDKVDRADRGEHVRLMIAVKQDNVDWLERTFHAVSNPDSPAYGKYVTLPELWQKVRGNTESVARVTAFLKRTGMPFTQTQDKGFFIAHTTVGQAESVFQSPFFVFRHRSNNASIVRAEQHAGSIPAELSGHVDFIIGHNTFPHVPRVRPQPSKVAAGAGDSKLLGVNPQSIDSAYNMHGYKATNGNSSQAIASFLKQYFKPSDLEQFQKKFNLPVRPIAKVEGLNMQSLPGMEASLDVQYIGATGRDIPTWFVSISHEVNHGQEDFLMWVMQQLNDTSSPWVHSVSYGDVEASIPLDYKQRVNTEFMKFGATGRSVLIAAGDSGVSCNNRVFSPDWPTSSPYATSVGGTESDGATSWSDGGGGFSNTYGQPQYQTSAVNAYLNSGVAPASSYFNASGRAYPDVSAFATNFEIVFRGVPMPVSGTSCSTPTFAGVVAALNDIRFNSNRPPLGFLNPLLYKWGAENPNAFNDIQRGSNPSGLCPGFKATKGWDPASGWGSPNFGIMRTLV